MKVAVVGHVEWVTFARVDRVPVAGEIVHADEIFEVPAGGGPVAAVQLLKLAGGCTLFTALGDDELGHRAHDELVAMGLRVETTFRSQAQRRAFTHVDAAGERTITVMGPRIGPHGDDALPWDSLDAMDGVYFCAGDDDALRIARQARVLVATARERERIARADVYLDAVVGSGQDPAETYVPADPPPGLVVETMGAEGGRFVTASGASGRFGPGEIALSRGPGAVACSYGAGDSFVAALTYALAEGMPVEHALRFAADRGAACLAGRGPYEGQVGRG